jgi:hypothetical protein
MRLDLSLSPLSATFQALLGMFEAVAIVWLHSFGAASGLITSP